MTRPPRPQRSSSAQSLWRTRSRSRPTLLKQPMRALLLKPPRSGRSIPISPRILLSRSQKLSARPQLPTDILLKNLNADHPPSGLDLLISLPSKAPAILIAGAFAKFGEQVSTPAQRRADWIGLIIYVTKRPCIGN